MPGRALVMLLINDCAFDCIWSLLLPSVFHLSMRTLARSSVVCRVNCSRPASVELSCVIFNAGALAGVVFAADEVRGLRADLAGWDDWPQQLAAPPITAITNMRNLCLMAGNLHIRMLIQRRRFIL